MPVLSCFMLDNAEAYKQTNTYHGAGCPRNCRVCNILSTEMYSHETLISDPLCGETMLRSSAGTDRLCSQYEEEWLKLQRYKIQKKEYEIQLKDNKEQIKKAPKGQRSGFVSVSERALAMKERRRRIKERLDEVKQQIKAKEEVSDKLFRICQQYNLKMGHNELHDAFDFLDSHNLGNLHLKCPCDVLHTLRKGPIQSALVNIVDCVALYGLINVRRDFCSIFEIVHF